MSSGAPFNEVYDGRDDLTRFNIARYRYGSIEALRANSIPIGAEADATWVKAPDGTVTGSGNFNAILRDYERLGILLANDGAVGNKQIVPRDYLLQATDWYQQPVSRRKRPRDISATATCSGCFWVRNRGLLCLASTAS
jgi:CubicO group peptidase (beta-lactamase class C family)